MKSYEIYKAVDPTLVEEMLMFFREEDRNLYKTSLATLATNRKLRPVFIQKKPVVDQIKWIHSALMFKQNSDIGEHLIQVWFMKAKSEVLILACDSLGIPHNGEGYVEGDLPDELDEEKLNQTVNNLIGKFGEPLTSLYLHIFNLQVAGGWENLSKLLNSDSRVSYSSDIKDTEEKSEAKPSEAKPEAKTAAKKASAKKAAKKN